MDNSAIIIDVGSDRIRVSCATLNSSSVSLSSIKEVSIAEKKSNFDIFETSLISEAVKECCQDLLTNIPSLPMSAYINLPNPYLEMNEACGVFVSKNRKNIINSSDINKAIESAKDSLNLPDERIVVDKDILQWVIDEQYITHNPLNMGGNRIEAKINFITANAQNYQHIDKMLESLGFTNRNIYPSILTLQEALLSPREKEIGVILIDIGSAFTNVIAYKNSRVVTIFTYPHGSRDVTEELSTHYNISYQDAENMKAEHSSVFLPLVKKNYEFETKQIYTDNPIRVNCQDVSSIAANKMMEILISIKKKIKQTCEDIKMFEAGVMITGGGSLHKGCKELCAHIFKLPTALGLCQYVDGLEEEFITPRYSNILALSRKFEHQRDENDSNNHTDNLFIPEKFKIKDRLKNFFEKFTSQNARR